MARWFIGALATYVAAAALGQPADADPTQQSPGSNSIIGAVNEYLAAGAEAMQARRYDDGIRLTEIGLERPMPPRVRADALSNLCAAYAAKGEPDRAITHCTESIALSDANWRAFSNRSYAYFLKGEYALADADLAVAVRMSPEARQVAQIRGMLNERTLRPRVTVQEHP